MEMENQLVELCLNSACESKDSVEKWRRQKRSLERLPSHLADALLRRLHARRLLYPSLLEYFSIPFFVCDYLEMSVERPKADRELLGSHVLHGDRKSLIKT